MSEKQDLKPCPFCGGPAVVVKDAPELFVTCADDQCSLHGTFNHTESGLGKAVEAWNTRYEPICHWEHTDRCTWTCSNCGVETDVLYRYWLHCPVCGAKVVK